MDNKEYEVNNASNATTELQQFEYEISKCENPTKLYLTRKKKIEYYISPVHSNESDVDISDTDPTYEVQRNAEKKKIKLFNRSSSSSSSSSSDTSSSSSSNSTLNENTPLTSEKTKKRTRNPCKWKQNLAKRLRNSGQPYVSMSKSKRIFPARSVKPPCNEKCRLKCRDNINENERALIFRKFWDLADINKQRLFVQSCLQNVRPRYKYTNAERPRSENKAFFLTTENDRIRVCKVFFKNTLNITDRMIRTTTAKIDPNGFVSDDYRGAHKSHTEIDPELLQDIKNHINSIPRIESHYLRAQTTREYIDGGKNIADLFRDFKEAQKNKNFGKYCTYYNVFTTHFNLGFYQPKIDQCDLCLSYNNTTGETRNKIEEEYKNHLEEKELCRKEKYFDRLNITDNKKVLIYDLQAVLQCPRGDTSAFYYKSKLNAYNFTLVDLNKLDPNNEKKRGYSDVHCFYWNETDAKRGSIEIGSSILKYFELISTRNPENEEMEITFFSDNCCGQNKNKVIATLYLYAVSHFNIKVITHKFLIKGHTQNEGDNVHSLIEKEVKKNLKSGPIYSPHQYVTMIKNAKKSNPPFKVHELTFESFINLKKLQEEWGYNYNVNTSGNTVLWNDIKVMMFKKEKPFSFFYKTSYKQESFSEVKLRNKRKKMLPVEEIILEKAYNKKIEISENKKKDLKELISKKLIP